MRAIITVTLACLAVVAGTAAAAESPEGHPFWVPFSERPQASLFIGPAGIGNPLMGGGPAPEVTLSFETSFSPGRRIRFDAARATWLSKYGGDGIPLITESITLKTLSVSVGRVAYFSEAAAGYMAFGVGMYRFGYHTTPLDHPWRRGVDVLMGLELLGESRKYAFTVEGRIDAAAGPDQMPYLDYTMVKASLGIGAKLRF